MSYPDRQPAVQNPPSMPPLDEILSRSQDLESILGQITERLRGATDNIIGAEPESKSATNLVPRGGAIVFAILNSQDRLTVALNALIIEVRRVEGLAVAQPSNGPAHR
jgi:hypothetical protein